MIAKRWGQGAERVVPNLLDFLRRKLAQGMNYRLIVQRRLALLFEGVLSEIAISAVYLWYTQTICFSYMLG